MSDMTIPAKLSHVLNISEGELSGTRAETSLADRNEPPDFH